LVLSIYNYQAALLAIRLNLLRRHRLALDAMERNTGKTSVIGPVGIVHIVGSGEWIPGQKHRLGHALHVLLGVAHLTRLLCICVCDTRTGRQSAPRSTLP